MSRRSESDPGFGSDSFLDIIANIVGILIILIVVAGVKVSRQPLIPRQSHNAQTTTQQQNSAAQQTAESRPRANEAPLATAHHSAPMPQPLDEIVADSEDAPSPDVHREAEFHDSEPAAETMLTESAGETVRKLPDLPNITDDPAAAHTSPPDDAPAVVNDATHSDKAQFTDQVVDREDSADTRKVPVPDDVPEPAQDMRQGPPLANRLVWTRPADSLSQQPDVSAPVALPVPRADENLIRRQAELLASSAALRTETETVDRVAKQLDTQLAAVTAREERARNSLSAAREQLKQEQQAVIKQHAALRNLNDELAQHIDELRLAKGPVAQVQTLEHKLTPIGREVTGDELHFRLEAGRVSHVPVQRMLNDLKRHLRSQANLMFRQNRHTGRIGPVDGYYMQFVVERAKFSIIDDLRYGAGTVRIGLSEWRLQPSRTVIEESVQTALGGTSNFGIIVRGAERDSTMTFWVYPDSFPEFAELRHFVQEFGHTVAARPLPKGMPIAGSPQGTRSVAQ